MTASPPFLRPFWRYFGGKWRAAPKYPAPVYSTIIEPFAGAAGYSLRYYDRDVVLVEKYPIIAEIWRYLIGADPDEIRSSPLVDAVADLPASTPPGLKHLIGFSMNAAAAVPCRVLSAGRVKMRATGRKFEGWSPAMRERVASQVSFIRHWRVVEGDYTDAPPVAATWFIDPPYQVAGKHYKHGSRDIDYQHLGTWCRARAGQTIVCEAAGAGWLPFKTFRTISASAMNTTTAGKSHEVIWENT